MKISIPDNLQPGRYKAVLDVGLDGTLTVRTTRRLEAFTGDGEAPLVNIAQGSRAVAHTAEGVLPLWSADPQITGDAKTCAYGAQHKANRTGDVVCRRRDGLQCACGIAKPGKM